MNILIVNSSALGDASVSSRLTRALAEGFAEQGEPLDINVRDIGRDPIPHLVSDTISAIRGVAETGAEAQALALSDTLIEELRRADLVVIGAPMYNFGISSALKAWFDHILRPQVTFRYTGNGPEGLLPGKRVIVIETRGGVYGEGPAREMDHQEPHLRSMLGFMGITDVSFVRVEGMAFGPEAAEKAIEGAMSELGRLSGQARALAA